MPHDPKVVHSELVTEPGTHRLEIIETHEAPAGPDGEVLFDEFQERDTAVQRTMYRWLFKHYPGHFWVTGADLRNRIVMFKIGILMGEGDWWAINLRTHPDIIREMHRGAGEILERFGLRRGRFELGSFLEAREKYSPLVVPGRKIPG
jgi:hypothetical protein